MHMCCKVAAGGSGQLSSNHAVAATRWRYAVCPVVCPAVPGCACLLCVHRANRSWLDFVYQCHDHNIHHYYGEKNFNFGLYFRFWDKLLGTYKHTVPSCKRLNRKGKTVGVDLEQKAKAH